MTKLRQCSNIIDIPDSQSEHRNQTLPAHRRCKTLPRHAADRYTPLSLGGTPQIDKSTLKNNIRVDGFDIE